MRKYELKRDLDALWGWEEQNHADVINDQISSRREAWRKNKEFREFVLMWTIYIGFLIGFGIALFVRGS